MKLVIFDMDGTLLDGRTIYAIGERFNLLEQIKHQMSRKIPPFRRSMHVAMLLKGLQLSEVRDAAASTPIMKGAKEAVRALREHKYRIGIITDSYTQVADDLCRKLRMDFIVANRLVIKNGVLTGGLVMPMGWEKIDCLCRQSVCKHYHLTILVDSFGCSMRDTVAVGDNAGDLCMIRNAGLGIAFQPKVSALRREADIIIERKDLREVVRRIGWNK